MELSHIDKNGNARMVSVADKNVTVRRATASGKVIMQAQTMELLKNGAAKKGDVLTVATVAGINAAKHNWELIPMCHNISLDGVDIIYNYLSDTELEILSTVSANAKTGAEMEALTAVAIAALTVYDMLKAADKNMVISDIRLLSKSGGKSGEFRRIEI